MTTDDLDRLEQIAKAATPGPWTALEMLHYGKPGTGFWYVDPLDDESDADLSQETAAHIAAFNPETAQQLITAIRTEREARAGLERAHQCAWDAVRDGVELDAYRVGKWDLDQAIRHRILEEREARERAERERDDWKRWNGVNEFELSRAKEHLATVIKERDALAQQVEALRQERDDWKGACDKAWFEVDETALAEPTLSLPVGVKKLRLRAERAESALTTAQQDAARLREALEWLVNLGYGVGKGGTPETGEIEAALEHGRAALTAPADPTGGQ